MIYVASPYSHPLEDVREYRYKAVLNYALRLAEHGILAFSPVVYGHQFAVRNRPDLIGYEHWSYFNEYMMRHSKEIRVLKIEGWQYSRGITHEINYAYHNHIPLNYAEHNA